MKSSQSNLQIAALIGGSFLSGFMMSIWYFTVPLMLATNKSSPQMLRQFVNLYEYGTDIMPPSSISVTLLYGFLAYRQRGQRKFYRQYALAGALTLSMIPYTLLFVFPINNRLFALAEQFRQDAQATVQLEDVKKLLQAWNVQHLMRSLGPLFGAIIGSGAFFKGLDA